MRRHPVACRTVTRCNDDAWGSTIMIDGALLANYIYLIVAHRCKIEFLTNLNQMICFPFSYLN